MSSKRMLNGDAQTSQLFSQVFHLSDPAFQIIGFGRFFQSNGQRIHVASGHSSVGDKSFEHDVEGGCFLVPFLISGGNKTADIDNAVLLAAHGHPIGIREHFGYNFFDCFPGITSFTLIDKPGIFGKTGRIHDDWNTIHIGQLFHFADILHRNRLAT